MKRWTSLIFGHPLINPLHLHFQEKFFKPFPRNIGPYRSLCYGSHGVWKDPENIQYLLFLMTWWETVPCLRKKCLLYTSGEELCKPEPFAMPRLVFKLSNCMRNWSSRKSCSHPNCVPYKELLLPVTVFQSWRVEGNALACCRIACGCVFPSEHQHVDKADPLIL